MNSISYYGDYDFVGMNKSFTPGDKRENLLLGLPQKIRNYEEIEERYQTDWFNSPDTCTELTDGVYATEPVCGDKAFFRFTAGAARSIVYDLGGICTVDSARIGVLKEVSTGVRLPVRVSVRVSADGIAWQTACEITGFASEKENDIVRLEKRFSEKFAARYVEFSFMVVVHLFVDEIEVFGVRSADGGVTPVADDVKDTDFPGRYASSDTLGAKDVLLSYICHDKVEPITKDIFLPHVAYIENGEIKDTLFDSYLFLPYVAFLYQGYEKRPLKKEDWQKYIDCQFTPGRNMDALEEAVAEVGRALGKPDLCVTTFFSILYPVTKVTEFGEVGGKNLDFTNLGDRKAALKWLIDEQLARFEEKKYKHIKLNGFYWFTEEISYSDEQLLELLRFTTDYVRSKGFITTWIPYFHATGYNDWRHLGFDQVCYQPNYAFNQSVPDSRLFDAAATAKLLGMSIELEIGGTADWNIERIKKYYAAGAITGYMKDASHMYYQGGVPGEYYRAYVSDDPKLHSVYTDTYRFIKGTFDPSEVEFD